MGERLFVKLGGSLITDKRHRERARLHRLQRLAAEMYRALEVKPDLQILLGHGSGSFGHWEAAKYQTQAGVHSPAAWRGFARVSAAALRLNRLVLETFLKAGLPVISLQPASAVIAKGGKIITYHHAPITAAWRGGLLPLIFGDVAFDRERGGTILSTETLFAHLATPLHPQRILLLGNAPGVLDADHQLIPRITPATLPQIEAALRGAAGHDVTGGMADKVHRMIDLVRRMPGLQVWIMGGREPDSLFRALTAPESPQGTCITGEAG